MKREHTLPRDVQDRDDEARTEEAKSMIEDYVKALRDMVQKLRRKLLN